MARYIMVTNSKNYIHASSSLLANIVPGFLLLLNGEEHHVLRKHLNPAFNSHTVNDFIPVFEKTTRKVVALWETAMRNKGDNSVIVAAQTYMSRLTLEAMCLCGFDYEINSVDEPDHCGAQSFQRLLQGFEIRLSRLLPLQWLPTKANRQAWADVKFFYSTIKDVIAQKREKIENGDTSRDLLSRLIQIRDDKGSGLSDRSLFSQVGGFLFAGFETTSMNLTWTLLMLAEHPEVQEKARQEVMSLLPDQSTPLTTKIVDNLIYLTCVIKESLRLFPPVSVVFRQALQDDYLGGYLIPAGTKVGVSIGALHRLPENWSNPTAFIPERFLEPYDPYKFLPFNAGPYMCIGHIFSLTESKAVLALLLRHFVLELPAGYKYRRIRRLTIQPHPPLQLTLRPVQCS
ncbi:cytochrome P450 4d1-like isoform X2 [Physella acuta]|nr:cytochrome P450 4d1-like isoform X2 [Physella acuta]